MTNTELNDELFKKMSAEQANFKAHLLRCTPEEVLNHANEYAVREDILMELEELDLSDAQVKALLSSPDAMAEVYKDFSKVDATGHMDIVRECIENRADEILKKQQELYAAPIYRESHRYATEHGEMEQYRASYNANAACTKAVDAAIAEHYHDNRLSGEAVKDVVAAFGLERTAYITAITVRSLERDPRISHEAKEWARTVPVVDDLDSHFHNRNAALVARQSHPGLIDLFARMVRGEAAARGTIYKGTAQQARENGELEQYRTSNRGNIHCKAEIEDLLTAKWDGTGFPPDVAKEIVDRFGVDRPALVLASTLQDKAWDERFSSDNVRWAKTVQTYLPKDQQNKYSLNTHSSILDSFVHQFRKEIAAREQPEQAADKPSIKAQLTAAKAARTDRPAAQQRQKDKGAR